MDKDPIEIVGNPIDEFISDRFSGNLFIDMATNNIVAEIENGELDFDSMMVKSTIAVNCLVGHMKLMKLCAEHLTDSHKDYHTVITFLDKLQEISNECAEKGHNLSEELGL